LPLIAVSVQMHQLNWPVHPIPEPGEEDSREDYIPWRFPTMMAQDKKLLLIFKIGLEREVLIA